MSSFSSSDMEVDELNHSSISEKSNPGSLVDSVINEIVNPTLASTSPPNFESVKFSELSDIQVDVMFGRVMSRKEVMSGFLGSLFLCNVEVLSIAPQLQEFTDGNRELRLDILCVITKGDVKTHVDIEMQTADMRQHLSQRAIGYMSLEFMRQWDTSDLSKVKKSYLKYSLNPVYSIWILRHPVSTTAPPLDSLISKYSIRHYDGVQLDMQFKSNSSTASNHEILENIANLWFIQLPENLNVDASVVSLQKSHPYLCWLSLLKQSGQSDSVIPKSFFELKGMEDAVRYSFLQLVPPEFKKFYRERVGMLSSLGIAYEELDAERVAREKAEADLETERAEKEKERAEKEKERAEKEKERAEKETERAEKEKAQAGKELLEYKMTALGTLGQKNVNAYAVGKGPSVYAEINSASSKEEVDEILKKALSN